MLSLIVSVLAGVFGALGICIIGGGHWGWGIFLGIVIFFAVLILLSRHFGKKLQGVAEQVQVQIGESQSDAQRIINRFQSKPSSQKVLQSQVEKVMEAGVVQALETLDGASPIFKWNVLAERQINTLKMQLNFQIKRFEEADRLMSKILILEPLTLAMKMTRQYHNDDKGLEKSFRKGVKKFKYEKATLIYSVYAWMLLKRKAIDEALEVLTEAKDKTENEGVAKNWQHVANNKVHLYSNTALGEQWYALHLEQPPKAKASKGQAKNHPMAQKGRRKYR